MRKKQLGLSLSGLMVGAVIFIVGGLLVIKVLPSYMEFFAIKKVINSIASEKGGNLTVAEVRRSFDTRATVDDISTVKGADLEVTKEGSEVVISVAYRKEIPLVANMGLYIQFSAASK
jgi:hypothetical protein